MTSQSVQERLKEHNQSASLWTKGHKPFKIVYTEKFESKIDALKKEEFFKTGDGRRVLDRMLNEK